MCNVPQRVYAKSALMNISLILQINASYALQGLIIAFFVLQLIAVLCARIIISQTQMGNVKPAVNLFYIA